jgi:hypothetical protein
MLMPRGIGLGDGPGSCSNGGAWDPGLNVCCAPSGTPPMQDPCSILNNPAFIAQQNAYIQQDLATASPFPDSFDYQTLVALTSVPVNIGNDAVRCQSNPGTTFVDSMGVTITCPSASHTDETTAGQPMSIYTEAQLAQMLNSQYGGAAAILPGNAAYAPPPASTVQPTQQQLQTAAPPLAGSTTGGSTTGGSSSPSGGSSSPSASGSGSSSSSSAAASTGIDLSFLTDDSLISGLPNWAVAFGALAALMILPGLIGGRR